MIGEQVSWRKSDDFEEKPRGGPMFAEGKMDEHYGNWTKLTSTHAPPEYRLYRMTDEAEYDYYLVVKDNVSGAVGIDEADIERVHVSLLTFPGLVEHREETAYEEHR